MTERITSDITARITTTAIPMPFQFRGGPSELPRSWYEKNKHKHTDVSASTAEEEDISAASSPRSPRNSSLTGTSLLRAPGRLLRPAFAELH